MPQERVAVDGRASRWSGQHERRRAQFVEAALLAIAEEGPSVSTDQIARRAGVARTRLYKHFNGAAELNRAIATRAAELVVADLEPVWNLRGSPLEMVRTAVVTHLRWLSEHAHLYRYLTRHSASAAGPDAVADVKSSVAQQLTTLFGHHLEQLGVGEVHLEPLAYGLVGYVDAAAARWVDHPGGVALEQMVDELADAVWAVIANVLERHGIALDPAKPLQL